VDTHGPLSRSPGGIAALELLSSKSGRWEAAIFLFACMCGWKNTSAVEFVRAPRAPEVYNIGGSRHSNCSILEAIEMCEQISGRKLTWSYERRTASATTSGGSAMCGNFSSTILPGNFAMVCAEFSKKSIAQSSTAWNDSSLSIASIV